MKKENNGNLVAKSYAINDVVKQIRNGDKETLSALLEDLRDAKFSDEDFSTIFYEMEVLSWKENNPVASQFIASAYLDGLYIERNLNRAFQFLKAIEKYERADTFYSLAYIYLNEDDYWYNEKLAIEFAKKAYLKGDEEAHRLLAYIYLFANDKSLRDDKLGIDILKKTAKKFSDSQSIFLLALYFFNQKNLIEAKKYSMMAYKQGHHLAISLIIDILMSGEDPDFIGDENHFEKLLLDGVSYGLPNAMFVLGCMYMDEHFGYKNELKGFELLLRASDKEHPGAQLKLSEIYASHSFVIKDEAIAFDYLEKSAENGELMAKLKIAQCYMYGRLGQDIDKEKAYFLLATIRKVLSENKNNTYLNSKVEKEWNFLKTHLSEEIVERNREQFLSRNLEPLYDLKDFGI